LAVSLPVWEAKKLASASASAVIATLVAPLGLA